MYALIQKSDNKIIKINSEGFNLSPEKPFYWVECEDSVTTSWTYNGKNFIAPPVPLPPSKEETNKINEELRVEAYRNESDPIFFKWQRGEATEQEWLDKVNEIKERFPKV